jgi:tripartite-type tricarboxylate transporter receptor subunit TctC
MQLQRREFLRVAAGAVVLPGGVLTAEAQTYPARAVHLIVPFPPGGPFDILARPMAQWLSERLGQPFIIENKPGAGTNIATEAVIKGAPDGYTLLMVGLASAINVALYKKLNFNFMRDIAPIATISRQAQVMVVNPSVPAKTVPEFVAYAKANPGKINMASPGIGTGPHVAGELFKMMTGIDMVHVPYRGGAPALTDLLGGQVQVMFTVPVGLMDHIKAGKLRALAVSTATRSQALPNLPTMAEFVPGYEASVWFGIAAPRKTQAGIIDKLNKEINIALADAGMRARIADLGASVLVGSPADFSTLIAEETEKWANVVKFSGAKLD